jgi:hypothetical protein
MRSLFLSHDDQDDVPPVHRHQAYRREEDSIKMVYSSPSPPRHKLFFGPPSCRVEERLSLVGQTPPVSTSHLRCLDRSCPE